MSLKYKSRWRDIPDHIDTIDEETVEEEERIIPVRKIGVIAICLACYGLIIEAISVIISVDGYYAERWFAALRPMNLGMLDKATLKGINLYYIETPNFLNIVFYLVFLFSAITYIQSQGLKSKMIRFSFAIFLISALVDFLPFTGQFLSLLIERTFGMEQAYIGLTSFVFIFTGSLSLWVMILMNKAIISDTTNIYQANGTLHEQYINASKLDRLIHFVVDLLLCILIVSPLSVILLHSLWDGFAFGYTLLAMILAVSFCVIFYYLFFETFWGATPGKYITGSEVIRISGNPPKFKFSLFRTIIRFIPLDPFSFLWNGSWHDKLTNTRVIKEKTNLSSVLNDTNQKSN